MFTVAKLMVMLVVFLAADSAPVGDTNEAITFLERFGYLPPVDPAGPRRMTTRATVRKAIQAYQAFMGLPQTGRLDRDTVTQMNKPRCGIKDKVPTGSGESKAFKILGSRWRKRTLTYKITKYPSNDLSKEETDRAIREAFNTWSQVSPLRFVQRRSGKVHIEIRFEEGAHGDGDAFDGPLGVLAHAFAPVSSWAGDAHFDDTERWTIGSRSGTNLVQAAVHEFGHSLGLDHSSTKGAIMNPYMRRQPTFDLHSDDISAIQLLYPRNHTR